MLSRREFPYCSATIVERWGTPMEKPKEIIVPPLKWAGGKRWLVRNYGDLFPKSFNRYFEPFLGGAAIFFALQPKDAVLSDSNSELIDFYVVIRDQWQNLQAKLAKHQESHSKDYYYQMRASVFDDPIERAARFLYLNRTCWNGLYRVNKKGQFNVPIGTKSSVMLDTDDFAAMSRVLSISRLQVSDFEQIIAQAKTGDFVFADPPYTVRHNLNGFVKYNERIFSWEDQKRLKNSLDEASQRGVKFLLTNAAHCSINQLFGDVGLTSVVGRYSVLAGKSDARSPVRELTVRNYQ